MSWLANRRTPVMALLTAAALGMLAMWGFYSSDGAAKARERDARLADARASGGQNEALATASLEVEVATTSSSSAVEIIELAGVLEPIRATWVAAEIAGRILEIPAEEHAPIEAGGLIVQIDSALPRAELIRAQASHRLAKSELERQERLGSRSVASKAELDRARAEERRAFAAVLEARTRLDQTRITAPFAGLVNSLDLDPGAYVQPGTPIAEVLDLSTLEVTVLVGDRQISAVRVGAETDVRIDALGSATRPGRIVRVGGAPREGGQRFPVVVALDNREDAGTEATSEARPEEPTRLRPGMLAHVRFQVGSRRAIRLPARALLREFELDYVFVIGENDVARRVRVATRPVAFRPDQIEVTEGLTDGQRVAISAVGELRNGLRVIVR